MNEHERMHEMLARRSELSIPEEASLRQHLESCSACRELAAVYAQQTLLLRSLPDVDPPAALRSGVLRGIRQAPPRRWSLPRFVLAAPAAALALAVVVALALTHRPSGTPAHGALATVAVTPPRRGPGPRPVTVKRKEHRTGRRTAGHKHAGHGAPIATVAPVGQPPIVALGQPPSGKPASQPAAAAHAPAPTAGPAAPTPAIGSFPPQVSGHRTPPPATEVASTPVVVIGTRPATRTPVPTAPVPTGTPVPQPSQIGVAAQPATPTPTAAVPPAPTAPPTSTATSTATPLP